MKRKIALVLAAVMTTAMLPMNAMAASSNTADSPVSVKEDVTLLKGGVPVELKIQPRDEVTSGTSIFLTVENGKFKRELVDGAESDPFIFKSESTGTTYNQIVATQMGWREALTKYVGDEQSRKLPYGFKYINENELQVNLYPIGDDKVNVNNTDVTQGTPVYAIKLPISTEDSTDGEVKVTVDGNETSITSGTTHVVAKVTDDNGSTTASVVQSDITVTSSDTVDVPDITIKEDVAGTFGEGEVTLKVNGNYDFDTNATVKVTAGINADFADIIANVEANEITFNMPDVEKSFDNSKLSSIVITGITVIAEEDDQYGDINITVSGKSSTNITRQSIKVAERKDYGFALTVLEDVPTMFSGRTYLGDDDYDQDDFTTAEFRFAETTPDTWLTSRKLELSVPEGVKIIGADVTKTKYANAGKIEENLSIANDGQTLRIASLNDDIINPKEASEVEFELYLTAEATFNGDVTVSASGAGLDADALSPITVAKFVSPITIESAITKANMGYQAIDTADIKITENAVEALKEDGKVEIKIDSLYGENELGFADDDTKVTVDGEIEVKSFKVSNGTISFIVDSASYNNPSTITVSNVKVGTTRSIPYGSYGLLVGGDAIVNNYEEDVDFNYPVSYTYGDNYNDSSEESTNKYNSDFDKFDTDEGFEFAGYLTIVTEVSTLDKKVEVTIGASSIKVDGEDVAMDAAAYIQTSSNSTMVPLRFVSVALGVDSDNVATADDSSKVMWDAATKSATILYSAGSAQKIVQFTAGSPVMTIDGTAINMENGVVAEIVDGRMYVPFRALGQALGVPVSWDAETKTAIYNER